MPGREVPFVQQVERRVGAHLAPLVEADEDEVDLVEVVEEAYAVADSVAGYVLEQSAPYEQPVCAEGCVYCCYAPLEVSWAEAATIAAHLVAQLPRDGLEALSQALLEHEEASDGLSGPERYARGLPCPLLDRAAGRCMIYPLRPLRCRGANSLSVEDCERSCHDESAEIELNGPVYETYLGAWRALARVCETLDLPAEPQPLSRALRTALGACITAVEDSVAGD